MQEDKSITNCKDKAGWVSVQEARAAATQADWQHGRQKGTRLKPYLCNKCRLYHLATEYEVV